MNLKKEIVIKNKLISFDKSVRSINNEYSRY